MVVITQVSPLVIAVPRWFEGTGTTGRERRPGPVVPRFGPAPPPHPPPPQARPQQVTVRAAGPQSSDARPVTLSPRRRSPAGPRPHLPGRGPGRVRKTRNDVPNRTRRQPAAGSDSLQWDT